MASSELCPGHMQWPGLSALTELVRQIEAESTDLVGAEPVAIVGDSLTPAKRLCSCGPIDASAIDQLHTSASLVGVKLNLLFANQFRCSRMCVGCDFDKAWDDNHKVQTG